ncbi:hypothetical protein KSP39_PZI007985 [Platanthera zijinensis]|uniref:Uncharacterized protein n=1 Tax=Platanthera zijinensis TaxID=2320716 RepID=A0AAP0BPJ7_9ASPA
MNSPRCFVYRVWNRSTDIGMVCEAYPDKLVRIGDVFIMLVVPEMTLCHLLFGFSTR